MEREKVWSRHNEQIRNFVLSKVKDKDLCNDIMQDIYLKVHDNLHKVKHPEKVKPWLFTIARNIVNDNFRKQHVHVSHTENHSEENNLNRKFEKCLVPYIKNLPLIYKEAFIKAELENYSQLKLADELKISYSGLKSRVQRARRLLKKYFSECCNIQSDKYGNIVSYSEKYSCKTC